MSDRAPYSRVYWSVMDDEKFDGVRDDYRLMGAWVMLLIQADMAHPAPAHLPRTVALSAVNRLADCGLIDLLSGHRYKVHGLDAERERRRDSATRRVPSGTQQGPKRDPEGLQAKQSKDKQEQSTDARDSDDPAWLVAWWQIGRRRPPTAGQQKVIDDFLRAFDVTGEKRLTRLFLDNPADPIGAAMEDLRVFREKAKADAKADEEESAKRHAERRRSSGVDPKLRAWIHGEDVA